ncbi:MAG: PKD domain-containing protein [Planctomycetes bacterium]|nr:PKD domain-containing protein [Planctomycetota bacterium]
MRFVFATLVFSGVASGILAQPPVNSVHPLPPQTPAWLDGYAVRWPVRVLGEPSAQTAQSVLVRVPTGGWLKPDASDIAVQAANGKLLPAVVLSHDPIGDTIIQFKRHANDPWYWVYGVNPKAPPLAKVDPKADPAFQEGLTLELRDWAGDDLASWARVRVGLEKSDNVIGNAVVTEIMQNCNPARPDVPNKFAASYRGYLTIKKEGTYTFVANGEDATFLFIDGFKVFERPGVNRPLGTVKVKELEKIAGKVELKPGVHAFEVHQAIGESPNSRGTCALAWTTPDQPRFSIVPPTALTHPLYARVAAAERSDGSQAGIFAHGIDDSLESAGLKLFLVKFEANLDPKDQPKATWDFGNGTAGKGPRQTHVYFREGDYVVSLNAGAGLPPFKRRIRVWPEPGEFSPLSLRAAIEAIEAMEWHKLDPSRVREIFSFLQICEQPNRWPLMDEIAKHLLAQKELDLDSRVQFIAGRMEALTNQGKAADAFKLAETVALDYAKTPVLQVRLQLAVAAIHQYHTKDAASASKIYKAILEEHKRVEHPNLRLAAIRWGDLFTEQGDLTRASETYRVAATLGGEKFAGTSTTDATTRGALMRIAEQKLKAGEIQATRQLLERMELEYPGRRLDGLYCFMRAETDRHIGKYEDALRHYEMIFKLPQWAGYRDRATFGLADTYNRMGDPENAMKWYKNLKEGFPKFFESQKGPAVEKLLGARLARIKAVKNPADAFFKGWRTGFEPDEREWFGRLDYAMVRTPGLDGPHAAMLDIYPKDPIGGLIDYTRPLKNLTPGGMYWVEIWHRDVLRPAPPAAHQQPFIHLRLIADTTKEETLASANLYRNSHHQWHKLGFKIRAPLADDCTLKISFYNHTGATLYDALSIEPVTDRQLDSLTNFLEGGKAP